MRVRSPKLTIGQQVSIMGVDFAQFSYRRERNVPTWRGTLQPSETSSLYVVKVIYPIPSSPKVWILSPKLEPNAPHRYEDDSLCLYHPDDRSWTADRFISKTIVPWTALWLAFYEMWLKSGVWYGPEAPHNGIKKAF